MTQTAFEQNWHKRGFSFHVGNIKLEEEVLDAMHEDQDELFVNVNGHLEVTMAGKTFQLECMQELFIPAKSKHTIKNIGTSDCQIYYGYQQVT